LAADGTCKLCKFGALTCTEAAATSC